MRGGGAAAGHRPSRAFPSPQRPAAAPRPAALRPPPPRAGGGARSREGGPCLCPETAGAAAPLLTCHFASGKGAGGRGCGRGEPPGCPAPAPGPGFGTRGYAGKGSGTRPRSLPPAPASSLTSGRAVAALPPPRPPRPGGSRRPVEMGFAGVVEAVEDS